MNMADTEAVGITENGKTYGKSIKETYYKLSNQQGI